MSRRVQHEFAQISVTSAHGSSLAALVLEQLELEKADSERYIDRSKSNQHFAGGTVLRPQTTTTTASATKRNANQWRPTNVKRFVVVGCELQRGID